MTTNTDIIADSKFTGRERELELFAEFMKEVKAGRGQLVLVEGKEGVGKSCLMGEVSRIAAEEDFEVLSGRCMSLQQSDPYLPFLDALGGRIKGPKRSGKVTHTEELPLGLMGMMADNGYSDSSSDLPLGLIPITGSAEVDLSRVDIQTERDKFFNTVLDVITGISDTRPLILFIDDFHWADNSTLQLLLYLARNTRSSRIMICLAYRLEGLEHGDGQQPFSQIIQQMEGVINLTTIMLDRMSQEEISEIIKNILGVDDVPDRLLKKLYDESQGNPFFVEEVVKSLMDEGIILRHGHIWDAGVDFSAIRIPNTIKDVITHRIARLSESEKRILRFASVVGDRFTFDVLREVSGMVEEELLDTLDHLIEGDIIHEVQDSEEEQFVFDHKLTSSVIYDSMNKSRVRLMHKTVGDVIERLYSNNLEPWVFELARHFTLGKESMKTYKYSLMAGDKAFRALTFEKAGEYYISSLRIIDRLPTSSDLDVDAEKLRLSMTIGNIYQCMDEWSPVSKYYNIALDLSRKRDDRKAEEKTLIALGHSLRRSGNYRDAEEHYDLAAKISDELGDMESKAEIQRGLGYVHWRKGENDDAIEHYNQSISLSMKAGDLSSMAKTFIELGNVYNHWGDQEKAIEYYNKSLDELERLNDYSELARAHNNLGDSYLKMKNWGKAIEHLKESGAAAEKIGNKNLKAWALFNSAEALAYTGELDKAERLCEEALDICETQDDKVGMNGIFKNLGIIYRLKEEWDKAIDYFNKSIVILEMLDIHYDLGNTYFHLGKTYEAMGETMGAIDNFRMAMDLFENVGAKAEAKEASEKIKTLEGK